MCDFSRSCSIISSGLATVAVTVVEMALAEVGLVGVSQIVLAVSKALFEVVSVDGRNGW